MGESGMVRPNQREQLNKTVKSLDNDYVRSNEEQQQEQLKKRKQKIFVRRRFALYVVAAAILVFGLVDYLFSQRERLAEQKVELQAAQQQLKQANNQQEMLEIQISKLEDDEYIAKLARKEYFLSEQGEIIFTIPEKQEDKKEKK